ncbi:MAG TPA: kelch repeat-containing protein [Pyrinomonadaceae bacterium]|nr:kelch repeat-containing protein [Pyrinomonadaceae bacterium]
MKKQRNHTRLHVSLIPALIGLMSAATLMPGPSRHASAQAVAPSWSYTGHLNDARVYHTATLLLNGKVLITGGYNGADSNHPPLSLNSAELYDPATGSWSGTGSLNTARDHHTATQLKNGQILILGGQNHANGSAILSLTSAELYDPAAGTWSYTGALNTGRFLPTATVLQNGKVLVAGGDVCSPGQGCMTANSAELYDPATGIWSFTGNLNTARYWHTATLLPNGKVLVAGGINANGSLNITTSPLNSTELYDPATGAWTYAGNLNAARAGHSATLLANSKILAAGNYQRCNDIGICEDTSVAELYDATTGNWSEISDAGVYNNQATLLPSGKVLIVVDGDFAELYDPATETFTPTASLNTARYSYTTTFLPNGKILVAAGGLHGGSSVILNTAELYDPGISLNQIDDTSFFVRQHYRDFLNREADPDGLNFWAGEIYICGSDPQCIEVKRINDSASFFLSIEFQQTGYLVYRFHKAAYGNLPSAPVPVKLAEFLPDTHQISSGVIVLQTGWEQVLESNKQTFANDFVQRARFTSAFSTTLPPDMFVNALFANAGVAPTSNERSAAIAEFGTATNTNDVSARARALRRVAENATLAQQEFNRAFVLMQYFGYLRRNPNEAPDGNFDGYNFWLNKLNQFNGNYIEAEMVKAFLSSTEYRRRFGP